MCPGPGLQLGGGDARFAGPTKRNAPREPSLRRRKRVPALPGHRPAPAPEPEGPRRHFRADPDPSPAAGRRGPSSPRPSLNRSADGAGVFGDRARFQLPGTHTCSCPLRPRTLNEHRWDLVPTRTKGGRALTSGRGRTGTEIHPGPGRFRKRAVFASPDASPPVPRPKDGPVAAHSAVGSAGARRPRCQGHSVTGGVRLLFFVFFFSCFVCFFARGAPRRRLWGTPMATSAP